MSAPPGSTGNYMRSHQLSPPSVPQQLTLAAPGGTPPMDAGGSARSVVYYPQYIYQSQPGSQLPPQPGSFNGPQLPPLAQGPPLGSAPHLPQGQPPGLSPGVSVGLARGFSPGLSSHPQGGPPHGAAAPAPLLAPGIPIASPNGSQSLLPSILTSASPTGRSPEAATAHSAGNPPVSEYMATPGAQASVGGPAGPAGPTRSPRRDEADWQDAKAAAGGSNVAPPAYTPAISQRTRRRSAPKLIADVKYPVNYPAHVVPDEMRVVTGPPDSWQVAPPRPEDIRPRRYASGVDERNFFTVLEYEINSQPIIWDYYTGYVHLTGIWKAIGNSKADIVKLLDNSPELEPVIRRVRGGFLKIQGTWVPYDVARRLATHVCYYLRYALVPLFGPNFPEQCTKPNEPGFGVLQLNAPAAKKPDLRFHSASSSPIQSPRSAASNGNTSSSSLTGISKLHTRPSSQDSPNYVHAPQNSTPATSASSSGSGSMSNLQPLTPQQPQQQQQHPLASSTNSPQAVAHHQGSSFTLLQHQNSSFVVPVPQQQQPHVQPYIQMQPQQPQPPPPPQQQQQQQQRFQQVPHLQQQQQQQQPVQQQQQLTAQPASAHQFGTSPRQHQHLSLHTQYQTSPKSSSYQHFPQHSSKHVSPVNASGAPVFGHAGGTLHSHTHPQQHYSRHSAPGESGFKRRGRSRTNSLPRRDSLARAPPLTRDAYEDNVIEDEEVEWISPPPMPRKVSFLDEQTISECPSEFLAMLKATRSLQKMSAGRPIKDVGGGFECGGRQFVWDGSDRLDMLPPNTPMASPPFASPMLAKALPVHALGPAREPTPPKSEPPSFNEATPDQRQKGAMPSRQEVTPPVEPTTLGGARPPSLANILNV